MDTADVKYLDGEFVIEEQEPSTIDELTSLIGEEAVVENVNANLRYRNKYPRVYGLVSDRITSEHGFNRAEKSRTPGGEGKQDKVVLVSTMDHIRDFVGQNEATNKPIVEALFREIAPAQPLYVKGERTGGGGKVSQQALDTATEWQSAGTTEDMVAKIESLYPGYKVSRQTDGSISVEAAARGIQAFQRFLVKKAQDDAKNALK